MRFYLGAHHPHWLERAPFPLFVSHRRLAARRRLPRAATGWALDSGGFTELRLHGRWHTSAAEYVAAVRRYRDEIGGLEWAALMDWMCEPFMLAKTGLTIAVHQAHTVANYLELHDLAPDLPSIPRAPGLEPRRLPPLRRSLPAGRRRSDRGAARRRRVGLPPASERRDRGDRAPLARVASQERCKSETA
jgi:hypothetical protein